MANWGILKANEDLYVIINGMRARNIKNGEEHGPIKHIDHGRNSDELWIHFRDEDAGKRINRKLFKSFQGQFLELENALSNAAFIGLLREHGITKKRKNVSTKSRQSQSQRVVTPSVDNIEGPRPTVPTTEFKNSLEKKVGTFNVKIENLQEAPEDFRCRTIDQEWVAEIKSSIRQAPGELVTKVPVMVPLNVATDPNQFQESMLDGALYLIGGNHVVKACKELLEEEKENEEFRIYSNISADVFLGLSPEQAKLIGNHHNRKTTTKKVLFQDQVLQAREIFLKHREEGEEMWKETAAIILGNLHERTYTKKSLSLVLSVASQEEEVFFQIERLFELWNSHNSMKDFPQQIFKNIPCVEGSKICQYLRRVDQVKDIKTVAEAISKDRKKSILEQVFTSRTGCQTWEEASERYALHAEKVEEFLDSIKVSQRLIPRDFIKLCDEAVRQEVPADLRAVINVAISEDLNEKQREYLEQEKRKFEIKICKGLKKLKTAVEE